jgi:hypothetical protein
VKTVRIKYVSDIDPKILEQRKGFKKYHDNRRNFLKKRMRQMTPEQQKAEFEKKIFSGFNTVK